MEIPETISSSEDKSEKDTPRNDHLQSIGSYTIVSELGHGGMGVVYKAYDAGLSRHVALKILRPELLKNSRFIERFKKEARNQAQLSHPGIVTVHGFIEEKDASGIIMEYVDGETLESIINRDIRLHYLDALYIIKQVLLAVEYAHSKGLIHRDIKPSNIIISSEGVVKIMDFGISKSMDEKENRSTNMNVGTLLYMSPEQIRGEAVMPQSDIYSIGVTLYEMITGNPPFDSQSEYEVTEGHLKKDPPTFSHTAPETPSWLEEVTRRALEKKSKDRFASAAAMLECIRENEAAYHKEVNKNRQRALKDEHSDKRAGSRLFSGRGSRRYKVRSAAITALIIIGFLFLVYFVSSQVVVLWKSGDNLLYGLINIQGDDGRGYSENQVSYFSYEKIYSSAGGTLQSMVFLDDSKAFVCGQNGILLKSTDTGKNWEKLNTGFPGTLYDICRTSSGKVFVVGDSSFIYSSSDGGNVWRRSSLKHATTFFCIRFINEKTGFIAGSRGLLLKTADAGESWYQVASSSNSIIYDLEFTKGGKLFAVNKDGQVLKSNDTGESWEVIEKLPAESYLKAIEFLDEYNGIIVGGGGCIFKTSDGGTSWKKVESPVSSALYDVYYTSGGKAVAAGSGGSIIVSSDEGESWFSVKRPFYTSIMRIAQQKELFFCGSNGTLYKASINKNMALQ